MKKFYSVVSSFDDYGHANAFLGDVVEAECKPEGTMRFTYRRDYYTDWFDTREEAQEFANTVK